MGLLFTVVELNITKVFYREEPYNCKYENNIKIQFFLLFRLSTLRVSFRITGVLDVSIVQNSKNEKKNSG
jgi:hypothetical protein